jgi:hypothetical protein
MVSLIQNAGTHPHSTVIVEPIADGIGPYCHFPVACFSQKALRPSDSRTAAERHLARDRDSMPATFGHSYLNAFLILDVKAHMVGAPSLIDIFSKKSERQRLDRKRHAPSDPDEARRV